MKGTPSAPRLIAVAVAIAWLPLLLLTFLGGTATGHRVSIPFLADYLPHGRYLLALPLLLLMDPILERRTATALQNVRDSGLVEPGDAQRFQRLVGALDGAWRNSTVCAGLVIITGTAAVLTLWLGYESFDKSNWMFAGARGREGLTSAGAWNLMISAPLARLLTLLAWWKLTVWSWFLWRLSRLRLQLRPLHPDRRCGLGFLGTTQLAFTPFVGALSVQLGCLIADSVRFQGFEPASFKFVAAGFVVLCIGLVLGPLLAFWHQAWLACERAEITFSAWGSHAVDHFSGEQSEARATDISDQLARSEISSLTDAATLFDRLLATRPVPIRMGHIVAVSAAAFVPMLLPLLRQLPLADIAERLARILL